MSCRNCIHQSVCYLVDSHGLTEMSFNTNDFGCSDYIDKDVLNNEKCENCTYTTAVIHAEWINKSTSSFDGLFENVYPYYVCTNCNRYAEANFDFCPHCGAKMDKE